jgi:hypothetical protein
MGDLSKLAGGSGGLPIGAVIEMNLGELEKYETSTGEVWLRSGIVDDEVDNYPEATRDKLPQPSNFNFSIAAVAGNANGVSFDGSHYWVLSNDKAKIFQYDVAGVYTGFSFSIPAQSFGLCWDGTHLCIARTNRVDKYTRAGAFVSYFSATTSTGYAVYIAWCNRTKTYWINYNPGSAQGDTLYEYTQAGGRTGREFVLSTGYQNVNSVCHDGLALWVNRSSVHKKWTEQGVGLKQFFTFQSISLSGLSFFDDRFCGCFSSSIYVFPAIPVVGLADEQRDKNVSYTKVK